MSVPYLRPRRLRDNALLRDAIAETHVALENLMLPVFVANVDGPRDITGMPGVQQHSIDSLSRELDVLLRKDLRRFIVFGVPEHKDARASGATDSDGIVPKTLRALRERFGDAAFLTTDVCLCSYTDTGHCGVLKDGRVDNDPSLDLLARAALAHAQAGADMVAPSDMMDGRVRAIRERLDGAGLAHVPIMSYAVKYASSLYGPFRHAADSAPKTGDRRGYQMDFRNRQDAVREALLDVEEGADIVMVKPGLAYLDIIRDVRDAVRVPVAAYQVSGEFSMIRYAAHANAIDERNVVLELWTALRRAGSHLILTYHASQAAKDGWL